MSPSRRTYPIDPCNPSRLNPSSDDVVYIGVDPREFPVAPTGDNPREVDLEGLGGVLTGGGHPARDKWIDMIGVTPQDPGDNPLGEADAIGDFIDEWGRDDDGVDIEQAGRGWFGGGGGGPFDSGLGLVSDNYDSYTLPLPPAGQKGDDSYGNPFDPIEGSKIDSYGVRLGGGYSSTDGKPSYFVGGILTFRFGDSSNPKPATKDGANADRGKSGEKRDAKPAEKPKSAVEEGVDDPKKPRPGTGTATPNPMADSIALPAPHDRLAWKRLRGFEPPRRASDDPSMRGDSESTRQAGRSAVTRVDWDLLIGGGHTDPSYEDDWHRGPRKPKQAGRRTKLVNYASDDPSAFGGTSAAMANARAGRSGSR